MPSSRDQRRDGQRLAEKATLARPFPSEAAIATNPFDPSTHCGLVRAYEQVAEASPALRERAAWACRLGGKGLAPCWSRWPPARRRQLSRPWFVPRWPRHRRRQKGGHPPASQGSSSRPAPDLSQVALSRAIPQRCACEEVRSAIGSQGYLLRLRCSESRSLDLRARRDVCWQLAGVGQCSALRAVSRCCCAAGLRCAVVVQPQRRGLVCCTPRPQCWPIAAL